MKQFMKKLLFLLIIIPFLTNAQNVTVSKNQGTPNQIIENPGGYRVLNYFGVPFLDSPKANYITSGQFTDFYRKKGDSSFVLYNAKTKTYNQILDATDMNLVNIKSLGVKGDGITNDAPLIQDAINRYSNLYFPSGTFLLDSAIIKISNRSNIKIVLAPDATLLTKRHGYGILEIDNCKNISITGGIFEGAYNFPSKNINGEDGGGEKHTIGGTFSLTRNGDTNNSSPNKVLYGGGWLGNYGIGILVHNGSSNVNIDKVTARKFNGGGIQVGFSGDNNATKLNYSKGINITNCTVDSTYDEGIGVLSCDGVVIANNNIKHIGHPDAISSDVTIDPGYGIGLRAVSQSGFRAHNVKIINNNFYDTKRKSIDGHNGEMISVIGNTCKLALITGIYMNSTSDPTPNNLLIKDNQVDSCGIATGGTVDAKMGIYLSFLNSEVASNIVTNSGRSYGILSNSTNNVNIHDNQVLDTTVSNFSSTRRGITVLGTIGNHYSNYKINNNIVRGQFQSGIYLDYIDTVDLAGNTVSIRGSEFIRNSTSTQVTLMANNSNITPAGYVIQLEKPASLGYITYLHNTDSGTSSNGLRVDIESNSANASLLDLRVKGTRVARLWASNGNLTLGSQTTAGIYKVDAPGTVNSDTFRGSTFLSSIDGHYFTYDNSTSDRLSNSNNTLRGLKVGGLSVASSPGTNPPTGGISTTGDILIGGRLRIDRGAISSIDTVFHFSQNGGQYTLINALGVANAYLPTLIVTCRYPNLASTRGKYEIVNGANTYSIGAFAYNARDSIGTGSVKGGRLWNIANNDTTKISLDYTGILKMSNFPTLTNNYGLLAYNKQDSTIGTNGLNILSITSTIDFGSVSANNELAASSTVTLTGAIVGSQVWIQGPHTAGINYIGYVTATNTITIYAINFTTSPIDPPSGSFKITLIQ